MCVTISDYDHNQYEKGIQCRQPHQFLDAGNSTVGMAQRVSEPIDSIAGLAIPIETNGNASTVERPKREWA